MPVANSKLRVAMIQDGARRRYALPLALHRAGLLDAMYTDWFSRTGRGPRTCKPLNHARIHRNPWLTLRTKLFPPHHPNQAARYQWIARQTARWIMKRGLANANVLLGFIRNVHPDLWTYAQQQGLRTVGDQIIAPAAIELEQARQQAQRWPGWETQNTFENITPFIEFESQSWAALDRILCMSDFVKEGLIAQGVKAEKIRVLPYPIDATTFEVPDRVNRSGPVMVGFVGALNLRKGAPCVLKSAQRFKTQQVQFVMVGQNHLNPDMLKQHQGQVQLVGKVPVHEVRQWMSRFDLLFFPSTCEGSAGVVMEAMASGLPIVTTPNSGSLVTHGQEGFLVPCDDMEGFYQAIEQLVRNKDLRRSMGQAGRQTAMKHNLAWYETALAQALNENR